jgi:hypothetical protein
MGMDVYGVNPIIRVNTKKPERPKNGASEEVVKKYFQQLQAYEEANVGIYFRNNVWWWRPLANFIIEKCDWLTTEQKERLHDNSGFEFSQHEAMTIADTLQKKVDDGTAHAREEVSKKEMKVAEEWNAGLQKQQEALGEEARKETGNKNIVPRDYPKHLYKKWDDLQGQTDYKAHYPFREANVKEFICFLRECGGFRVC